MPDRHVTNSASEIEGRRIITAEGNQTITGRKTFNTGAGVPPFDVAPGSGMVDDLDVELLQGLDPAALRQASALTGILPDAAIPDPLPARSGENLHSIPAANLVGGPIPALVAVLAESAIRLNASTINGSVNDFDPGDMEKPVLVIPRNHASDCDCSGMVAGVAGQIAILMNLGAGVWYLRHESGLSAAGNQFSNMATSGRTPIAQGGHAIYVYDDSESPGFWRLTSHDQGAWITPTFDAADFTANGSMTWTVGSGDVATMKFRLDGKTVKAAFVLTGTDVGGTPSTSLQIEADQFGGFTAVAQVQRPIRIRDNSVFSIGYAVIAASDNKILCRRVDDSSWTASGGQQVSGDIEFEAA